MLQTAPYFLVEINFNQLKINRKIMQAFKICIIKHKLLIVVQIIKNNTLRKNTRHKELFILWKHWRKLDPYSVCCEENYSSPWRHNWTKQPSFGTPFLLLCFNKQCLISTNMYERFWNLRIENLRHIDF